MALKKNDTGEMLNSLWPHKKKTVWKLTNNKTLGRAQDPRANGAWLSKLTEWNMKCLS